MNFWICQTAFFIKIKPDSVLPSGLFRCERYGMIQLRKQMPNKAIIHRLQLYNGNYFPSEQPKTQDVILNHVVTMR